MKENRSIVRTFCCALAIWVCVGDATGQTQTQSTNQAETNILTGVQPPATATNKNNVVQVPAPKFNKPMKVREFSGRVEGVDKNAKTLLLLSASQTPDGQVRTHGTFPYQVTDKTKFSKGGKPATLEDFAVGVDVKFGVAFGSGKPSLTFVQMEEPAKPAVESPPAPKE